METTFEEIQKELRKRYPGTTAVHLEANVDDVHLNVSYKPLNINVKVPYCEDLDTLCISYADALSSAINSKITYHRTSIKSLEYFKHCIDSTIPELVDLEKLANSAWNSPLVPEKGVL